MAYYIINYAFIILLILLASLIYFRKRETGIFEGVYLGFIFIFVGVVLNSILTIPLFLYMQYLLLISKESFIYYALNLIICTIIGFLKK